VMNNPYLVQNILDLVGPGQHLYVSTISKLVGQCYALVEPIEVPVQRDVDGTSVNIVVDAQMTLYSEMCKSESRLMLAVYCNVQHAPEGTKLQRFTDGLLVACSDEHRRKNELKRVAVLEEAPMLQNILLAVGRYADKALLRFAYEQLNIVSYFSVRVTVGAVMSDDLDKLQWLHSVLKVPFCIESSKMAASCGDIIILDWLYKIHVSDSASTSREASAHSASGTQLLHAKERKWHDDVCHSAIAAGHLNVLQWHREHDLVFSMTKAIQCAARFGRINILNWLMQQEGARLGVDVMNAAAQGGQLHMCQHLRNLRCALKTLEMAKGAGCNGSIPMMTYILQIPEAALSHALFTQHMLLYAGAHGHLAAAEWLREQGAEWPTTLGIYDDAREKVNWSGDVLEWARDEGCTSLLYDIHVWQSLPPFKPFKLFPWS
jgi:hypothetical protein